MKLYSRKAELKAIRSICTSKEVVAAQLLSSFDESWFQYETTKAAYKRIVSLARKRGEVVRFDELVTDPSLNEDHRDELQTSAKSFCKSRNSAERLIEILDEYRIARNLYSLAKDIYTEMKEPSVDVRKLMDTATLKLTAARAGDPLAQQVRVFGRDCNALDLVDEALDRTVDVTYKTGFADLDDRQSGVPSDGLMLLAATTSGGKSTVLQNLLTRMYKLNKISVCNTSLEMSDRKQMRRLMSQLTKIPLKKFIQQSLSKDERRAARKAIKRLNAFGDKNNCRYVMLNPTQAVTIDQLLMLLKPFGFQVIGIDYASLLDTNGEKDQWKSLGEIARRCKIFSEANRCLIILLCQLDSDDDHIRYSKAMLEHADVALTWNYSKPEQRDTKVIPVNVKKFRDGELFSFELYEQFEIMSVGNMPDSEARSEESKTKKASENADSVADEDTDVVFEGAGSE